jgi:hypothetical protein
MRKAFQYYKLAADQGCARAQAAVGACYRVGVGARKDMGECFKYYKMAADGGDAGGQNDLGAGPYVVLSLFLSCFVSFFLFLFSFLVVSLLANHLVSDRAQV